MNWCDRQFNLSYKEGYMNLVCICQSLCFSNLICFMADRMNYYFLHLIMSCGGSLEVAIVFLSVPLLPDPCSIIRNMVGVN